MKPTAASYALWGGICVLFATTLLVVSFEGAMHFAGVAIDGPFQLYNALRRIQAGFRPGVDFQYFHGLGLPYLYYAWYRMFGGGLRGSELARELLTSAAYPAVFLIFFRAFVPDWTRALCLTAIALAASFILKLSAVLFALNGMLGVRSALPTLIPVVLYLARRERWRIVAPGIALGVALFLSTEQGLAAITAYVLVSAVAAARRANRRRQALESTATIAIAVSMLLLCLIVAGGFAGMRGALRYNFRLVPMDQYWFFGAPPNVFVPSWSVGARMAFIARPITEAILLVLLASVIYLRRLWRESDGEVGRRNFALAMLPVYGLISCGSLLGVFTFAYVQPCWRVLIMVGLLELATFGERYDARSSRGGWLGVPRMIAGIAIAATLWTTVTIGLIRSALGTSLPHILGSHMAGEARFAVAGIWPATLDAGQRVIDAHRGPQGEPPLLWSTYAGWIEARNGIFHPSFDYIIQALGPENRQAYVAAFRDKRPQLAQTVRPTYTQYESWLEGNDWLFYDELLRWYSVIAVTPWSFYWERRATPSAEPRFLAMMNVPAGITDVTLPPVPDSVAASTTLLEVEVEYDTRNPLHSLPIIGPSPRYLIEIEGAMSRTPVSLDPFVRQARFPIILEPKQKPILHFGTYSLLPGASWTARTVRVWVRPIDSGARAWLSDLVKSLAPTTD